MKKLLVLGSLAAALAGCAAGQTRNGAGLLFTSTKDSITATANVVATKTGEACATNVLGLVSTGDMSIEAAKAAGRIQKVASVDFSQFSVLGVFASSCTIVKGE